MMRTLALCLLWLLLGTARLASAQPASVSQFSLKNEQGLDIPTVFARPAGPGPFPAVVMLHGCSGIYSDSNPAKGYASLYIAWATRLLGAGYAVLATDSFTPRGGPQNQCGNGSGGVSEVDDRPSDARAAYSYLASHSDIRSDRIGLLGWSHGGSTTLATMSDDRAERQFKVAVAYYPGCGLYNAFGGISTSTWKPYAPTFMLAGGVDPLYTGGYCNKRVDRAHARGASMASGNAVEILVYTGAQHSFDEAGPNNSLTAGKFTQADLDAKADADPLAFWVLETFLKN